MRISDRDGRTVREDGPGTVRAGRGERDGRRYANSSGGGIAATLDASYYKGAGTRNGEEREYIVGPVVNDGQPQRRYIVRRLTPLECCRLQGFPDWWDAGVEGSDSARYKMWGNGIALPCAVDVLGRIARCVEGERT